MSTSKLMDMIKNKQKEIQAKTGRKQRPIRPKTGRNVYRILPTWRSEAGPDGQFWHDFGQHFIKNKQGELKAVYVCTDRTFGKDCPICNIIKKGIETADDDAVMKALEESKSKGKVLFNVLDRDGDDPDTPVILELTPTTFEKIIDMMTECLADEDDPSSIIDLEKGRDVVIKRTGSGLNTEYTVMLANRSKAVPKSVLKKLHNLDEYASQEFAEGERKALAAVGNVTGYLPASLASDDENYAKASDDNVDDDVLEGESKPVEDDDTSSESEPESKSEEEEPENESDSEIADSDLDDILKDL